MESDLLKYSDGWYQKQFYFNAEKYSSECNGTNSDYGSS